MQAPYFVYWMDGQCKGYDCCGSPVVFFLSSGSVFFPRRRSRTRAGETQIPRGVFFRIQQSILKPSIPLLAVCNHALPVKKMVQTLQEQKSENSYSAVDTMDKPGHGPSAEIGYCLHDGKSKSIQTRTSYSSLWSYCRSQRSTVCT